MPYISIYYIFINIITNEGKKMLDKIFNPKSIAVIGAPKEEGKVGYAIMKNLMVFKEQNKEHKIYPINPKYEEVFGLKCYKSVLDVENNIDLAVIAIPSKFVPMALEECGKKGIKGAIIITAGFSEVGNNKLEEELKEIAKKYNIRIIGPNCLGIINMHNKLNASFSKEYFKEGNVAFISQSGAILTAILDISPLINVGFSKIISTGNKMDIQESDLMEYLANDDNTSVVVAYIEGLKDKKFIESAKKLAKTKPIIILKSGKSEKGKKAVSSHTGSLAGDNQIYNAVFKKSDVLEAETFEELVNMMHIFSTQPPMKRNNIGIITNAGGFGVLATDSCEKYNLNVVEFEESTKTTLKKYLPSTSSISNPLDLIGDATTERYKNAIAILKEDKNIDGLLIILTPQEMTKPLEVAEIIGQLNKEIDKPVVASFVGGKEVKGAKSYMRKMGIPSYISPENGVEALSSLYKYENIKKKEEDYNIYNSIKQELLNIKNNPEHKNIINNLFNNPNEYNAKEFLKINGISVPKKYLAKTVEDAKQYANKLNNKVVLKISSPNILHKSDAGCVIINPKDIEKSFNKIMVNGRKFLEANAPNGVIDGVLVEELLEGTEIIIGGKKDNIFGGVVMVGLGGIFVEVLKDVAFAISPISKNYGSSILKELKSYKILEGARGQLKRDMDYIIDVMIRVDILMDIYPNIKEIDINPLFVKEEGKGGCAGDALIIVDK